VENWRPMVGGTGRKELTHIALQRPADGAGEPRGSSMDFWAQAVARAAQDGTYKFALLFLDFDPVSS